MTDTLADSRTSSRMFTEDVPLVVEDVQGRPAAERAAMLAEPGFGRYFTDRMFVARYRTGQGWYDARLTAYGPLQLDPSDGGAALRPVDLRGAQGLRPARRQRGHLPAQGQRRPVRPRRQAPGDAAGARGRLLAAVDALVDADRDWVPTGADQTLYLRPYQLAIEPFLGVRPAQRVPVPGHRQPGRRLLPARRPAGLGLPLRGLHPGGARWHRRRQVRRQLRRQPARPGAGHRGRLRPGRLARRGGEALRRGDGRDEPVLRPRLRRRRRTGHPRAHRHAAARASPATR